MAFLHEHIILPLSDLTTGQRVHYYLRKLREAETWSEDRMRAFQQQRLQQLLKYAGKEVPFYREWFAARGFDPAHTTLEQLPIVNKTIMRQAGIERFTAEHFPHRQRIASRSSGSTGEPFSFYETKESYSVNMAVKLHSWYEAGYHLGDRYMKIANSTRQSHLKQWQDRVNNCLYVPFYSMSDDLMRAILAQIDQTRPQYIRSYPAPLFLLAQYRNSHPEYSHHPKHIFTTGSTLTQAHREEIERAFGCDIIDSYSCEGTPAVYETTTHNGYRTALYYGIIEVLDDNGQSITDGLGRVVSTDLWNMAHPFVRYDTQDLVEVKNGHIVRIMGRECESCVSANGTLITIHNLTKFFANEVAGIQAYRMICRKDKSVEIQVVVGDGYTNETEQHIVDHWQMILNLPVFVTKVNSIPLMHNNKHLTIVNE